MTKHELTIFEPGLPNTPGWAGLSQVKKEWLQEKTSNIKKFGAMEGLAAASGAIELFEVKHGLEGESMGMTDYLRTVFGSSERTGWKRLSDMEELAKEWPVDVIRAVAERGALLLRGTTSIGLRDLLNAAKELEPPKQRDEKTIDAFIQNKVREKLREQKADRRKGKALRLTEDDGLKILYNSGRRTFRAMKGIVTSADRRQVLKTVCGWWMEDLAIPGTIECKRISIPDGVVAKVGYPKGKKRVPRSNAA